MEEPKQIVFGKGKWNAYYLPDNGEDGHYPDEGLGFSTEQEAWDYVKKFNCKLCLGALKIDPDEWTACESEWLVTNLS